MAPLPRGASPPWGPNGVGWGGGVQTDGDGRRRIDCGGVGSGLGREWNRVGKDLMNREGEG